MRKNILVIILLVLSVALGNFLQRKLAMTTPPVQDAQNPRGTCTPAFVDGGGPYYKPDAPYRTMIAPPDAKGDTLSVSGTVLKRDCKTPIPHAVLDIWQANPDGNYEDSWYRGKAVANEEGKYTFTTMIPKGYGEGTGYRPPHIHFKVFIDNREIITSQVFFPEAKGKPGFDDAYIMDLREVNGMGKRVFTGAHDVVMP